MLSEASFQIHWIWQNLSLANVLGYTCSYQSTNAMKGYVDFPKKWKNNPFPEYDNSFSRVVIRSLDSANLIRGNDLIMLENELVKSRERISICKNELSNPRERFNNQMERISEFGIPSAIGILGRFKRSSGKRWMP